MERFFPPTPLKTDVANPPVVEWGQDMEAGLEDQEQLLYFFGLFCGFQVGHLCLNWGLKLCLTGIQYLQRKLLGN